LLSAFSHQLDAFVATELVCMKLFVAQGPKSSRRGSSPTFVGVTGDWLGRSGAKPCLSPLLDSRLPTLDSRLSSDHERRTTNCGSQRRTSHVEPRTGSSTQQTQRTQQTSFLPSYSSILVRLTADRCLLPAFSRHPSPLFGLTTVDRRPAEHLLMPPSARPLRRPARRSARGTGSCRGDSTRRPSPSAPRASLARRCGRCRS